MSTAFTLIFMVFCHIFDDYYLQGWLASAKQKKWWKENAPNPLYNYDYLMALLMHSMSWAFSVMFPLAVLYNFDCGIIYLSLFIVNTIIHGIIDNYKANKLKINLIVDQVLHLFQIICTFGIVIGLDML